jgi:hypothetical protein
MTTSVTLTPQQDEIERSFIRKLHQVNAAQNGKPQTIMVMLLPDGSAVFWHGVPAGVTNGRVMVDTLTPCVK